MVTQSTAPRFEASPFRATFRTKSSRLIACLVPAAAITGGLFLGMRALISTEDIVFPERTIYELDPYYEQIDHPEPHSDTPKPELKRAVAPPELPPIDRPTTKGAFGPVVFQMPQTVETPGADRGFGNTLPRVMDSRELQPVSPPVVTYPASAVTRGIEGRCDVRMDVTPMGRPYNVTADCSDRVFAREAVRAVSRVEFIPKLEGGQRVGRKNVIYPLEFQLPDEKK